MGRTEKAAICEDGLIQYLKRLQEYFATRQALLKPVADNLGSR